MALQKQSEEERRQQQNLVRASYGQQRFQDLQKIAGYRRDKVTDRGTSAVISFDFSRTLEYRVNHFEPS